MFAVAHRSQMPPVLAGSFVGSGAAGTGTTPALVQTSWAMPAGVPLRASMTPCATLPACCARLASSSSASANRERAKERSERMATRRDPAPRTISPATATDDPRRRFAYWVTRGDETPYLPSSERASASASACDGRLAMRTS